jgi:DNA-binding response OmpR family regulator
MEGFEKFKKDTYDLCILMMMPYKDGYTLAKEIREKNSEVPIIPYCKIDERRCFKRIQSADDYLNKAFDSEVLLMKIKAIIQRKSSDTKQNKFNMNSILENSNLNSKLRFLTFNNEEY